VKLNDAYRKQFGRNLCMTDSYRSYAAQVDVRRRKGAGMTADPGTSNHGWGLATDLCGPGGGFWVPRSTYDNWMHANAPKYGWTHPDWAHRNDHEPWHWGFKDGVHAP
jgi:LAS superfamily LD-carboxypeptidase LdcB